MCNTFLQQQRGLNSVVEPFSLSTLQLLRTCNRLILPTSTSIGNPVGDCGSPARSGLVSYSSIHNHYNPMKANDSSNITESLHKSSPSYRTTSTPLPAIKSPILDVIDTMSSPDRTESSDIDTNSNIIKHRNAVGIERIGAMHRNEVINENTIRYIHPTATNFSTRLPEFSVLPLPGPLINNNNNKSSLPAFEYIAPPHHHGINSSDLQLIEFNKMNPFAALMHRRPRGEKRPIPEEQKDDKYYERRKRNNEAAKKSRDARKIREDRIAFRAAFLEQENSILRAQVLALRDELHTMRELINSNLTISNKSST